MGGREARKAEAAAKKKLIADAGVALEKIEATRTIETLAAAIKAAEPFSSAASLQKALPAARQRLAALQAEADKARKNDFLSRVEEAEKRDMKHPMAKSKAEQQLRRYFEQVFEDADANKNKTWCVAAPHGSGVQRGRVSLAHHPPSPYGCAGTSRSFRWRWTSSHRVSAARTSRLPLTLPYAAAAPEPQRADWSNRPRPKHRSARPVHLTRVLVSPAAGQDEDGSGSIDAEEFMSRASQYQSLSEKIGDGHTCRKGSLASMSGPSAAAVKPEKPPAAAPLEGASHSKRSTRPAAVPLEEAPRSKSSSRPAAVPLEEAPHSRGSSHATVTPGSTPPLGRDSSPVPRTAATSTIRRESIVAGFTDADKEQAARLFAAYDDDGSGELDFDEFREARRRGQGPGVGRGEGRVAGGLFARAEPWR